MNSLSPNACAAFILLAIIGACALFSTLVVLTMYLSQPKFSYGKCSDFDSRIDVLLSFWVAGNKGLDGDGDWNPCEKIK